jgi:hypothetical protein
MGQMIIKVYSLYDSRRLVFKVDFFPLCWLFKEP